MKQLLIIVLNIILWGLKIFPEALGGNFFRRMIYGIYFGHRDFIIPEDVTIGGIKNISFGKYFRVCSYVKMYCENDGTIQIGDNFFANYNCFIYAKNESIKIGNDCRFGPDVLIINANHGYSKGDKVRRQEDVCAPISIGNDVWLGAKVIVLPGVDVGDGAVIAAGSVVHNNIEPFTVNGGVPAKKIKDRT